MYPDLNGKVALVTGGSKALGAGTSRALAENGVRVAVNGRDEAALAAVVDSIRAQGGEAIAVPADLTDADAVSALRDIVERQFGPVDIVAAFAGGNGIPTPTAELGGERWRATIESDLTSAYLTVTAFLPSMIERRTGSIVTMSSTAGRQPSPANIAYAAAKAEDVMLTKHLANEVAKHGIRVNCLAPSSVVNEKEPVGHVAAAVGRPRPLVPARPPRRPGRCRGRHAVPRLGRIVVDHRGDARHHGRPGHSCDDNGSPGT